MDRGQNSGGLMSSAGLVRYFDAEDSNAILLNPKTIIASGVLLGILVQLLTWVAVAPIA
ncbi:preprotein translocase subunit Sec61beta [Natronolimnobius baerhuensis]|uniref:Preprotein translocase subunit SecG n=1 Tax=Natronolimnobius baerhuensis TaxID=253108 RepID=A0A202E6J1_9EURY|nr:preprotein translocase subunit Sec61beta [Natronolimnobius baerhuensis]OVE83859.1 preprotein translocase subunit SecG [Natronolimnobius baerhuensis]